MYILCKIWWDEQNLSHPFAYFNGKKLHRIEHTKWIKQGQDCQCNN